MNNKQRAGSGCDAAEVLGLLEEATRLPLHQVLGFKHPLVSELLGLLEHPPFGRLEGAELALWQLLFICRAFNTRV